ncbi:molybdenum cofactor biosynthesis protein C [Candidatus Epulonipiscium fishelsonii]|uniref:Molybdenum cofactor biosynthesis protein C n=1 Tax=Candidatus Epulonipiscium fishelsonii TaxID=77094 RepID=A0ACC8XBS8_9FIRM|nr:molybdenum cofactor biosynthesis protein C [Epulopiscium sp. SCG-D08WGA-EpuloA1]OON90542.1 MAG: molybdenum cofactor biosynthesis protein C [Epulopiscium sp. AS2M-Bin002]
MNKFTHFDNAGNAIMVDVSDKEITNRIAVACGSIKVNQQVLQSIKNRTAKKGDVLGVARVAGIMGIKQTSNLIPMCHPLLISKSSIDFEINEEQNTIMVECSVKIEGKTGVEMEALNGVTIALLTIYDMCKAIDKEMIIQNIFLKEKMGGRSGHYKKQ